MDAELNVTVHIFAPFYKSTKKCVIFVRDLLWEIGINLNFKNNFKGWQDINQPMNSINYKIENPIYNNR